MAPDGHGEDENDAAHAVTIGPAYAIHAEAIAAVHVETWREAYAGILPDAVLLSLRRSRLGGVYAWRITSGGMIVACRGAAVVGFAGTARVRDPLGEGEVETLYVAPAWQGRGIGRALLDHALRRLADGGAARAFLWVLAANPNRFFYEHAGGRLVGRGGTVVGRATLPRLAYGWTCAGDRAPRGGGEG